MADGNILRWIANLEAYSEVLKNYDTYYVGHGPFCNYSAIAKQRDYFSDYCSKILKATNGTAIFTDETKKLFEETMLSKYPEYGCQLMVNLATERVAGELN